MVYGHEEVEAETNARPAQRRTSHKRRLSQFLPLRGTPFPGAPFPGDPVLRGPGDPSCADKGAGLVSGGTVATPHTIRQHGQSLSRNIHRKNSHSAAGREPTH